MVAFLLIILSINIQAEKIEENLNNIGKFNAKLTLDNSSGWIQLTDNGFGHATNVAPRGIAIYDDELYIGTHSAKYPKFFENTVISNIFIKVFTRMLFCMENQFLRNAIQFITTRSEGCEIWRYNYTTDEFTQIVGDESITGMPAGFNYKYNCLAANIIEFKNKLYVGTWSTPIARPENPNRKGAEIWRYDGDNWEQVVGNSAPYINGGFGNIDNIAISDLEIFNGYLYAGTFNLDLKEKGGSEIWRTQDGVHWVQVVTRGFKPNMSEEDIKTKVTNTFIWNMEVFQNQLYAGTFNSRYRLYTDIGMGCQLWRTSDGLTWEKVNLPYGNGFGEKLNYGIRTMAVYKNELFVGTAANMLYDKGCEIWKYDGIDWTPIISDKVPGVDPSDKNYSGFGSKYNKYVWSMIVISDDKLWIGTANGKLDNLVEPFSKGCEVWCYDGIEWTPVVKDGDYELPNGFGYDRNLGARAMIEYPKGSGNIVVGTFKYVGTKFSTPQKGLEFWMRIK